MKMVLFRLSSSCCYELIYSYFQDYDDAFRIILLLLLFLLFVDFIIIIIIFIIIHNHTRYCTQLKFRRHL